MLVSLLLMVNNCPRRKSCAVTAWSASSSIQTPPTTNLKTNTSAPRVWVSASSEQSRFVYGFIKSFAYDRVFADFSDRISKSRRVGYESGDYELVSDGQTGELMKRRSDVHVCSLSLSSWPRDVG